MASSAARASIAGCVSLSQRDPRRQPGLKDPSHRCDGRWAVRSLVDLTSWPSNDACSDVRRARARPGAETAADHRGRGASLPLPKAADESSRSMSAVLHSDAPTSAERPSARFTAGKVAGPELIRAGVLVRRSRGTGRTVLDRAARRGPARPDRRRRPRSPPPNSAPALERLITAGTARAGSGHPDRHRRRLRHHPARGHAVTSGLIERRTLLTVRVSSGRRWARPSLSSWTCPRSRDARSAPQYV